MKSYKFSICGWKEVTLFFDKGITDLISIGGVGQKLPRYDHFKYSPLQIHRLEFDDLSDVPSTPDPDITYPSQEHARTIIDIGRTFVNYTDGDVYALFHCAAGVSRSTASAFIVLNVLVGPGKEQWCLDEVVKSRSCARPNQLLVKHADELLEREGKMLQVVNDYHKQFE